MAETPAHRALRDSSRPEGGRDKDKFDREAAGQQGLTSSMQRWTPFLHFNVHASLFSSLPDHFTSLQLNSTQLTLHTSLHFSPPAGCAHSSLHIVQLIQPPGRRPEPRLHPAGCEGQRRSSSSSSSRPKAAPHISLPGARYLHAQHCIRTSSPPYPELLCVLSRRIRAQRAPHPPPKYIRK